MPSNLEEEFAKLLRDPKAIESLQRSAGLAEFKSTYNIERASPLKCPVCSQWGQTGGSLWIIKDGTYTNFVCRKCRVQVHLEFPGKDNKQFIQELREAMKG